MGLPSLVDDSGHFLKPCPDDRKGMAEVDLYRRVAAAAAAGAAAADSLAGFAPYVPAYRGTFRVDAAGILAAAAVGGSVTALAGDAPTTAARPGWSGGAEPAGECANFLRLEDVTAGYSKPCVIDLKVGLRTWSKHGHDAAYIAKRIPHDERSGQADVGFKVCGMQTWERGGGGGGAGAGAGAGAECSVAGFGVIDRGGGWVQHRRPYEWARNLCSREHVRSALEDFVSSSAGGAADDALGAHKRNDTTGSDGDSNGSFHSSVDEDNGSGGGGAPPDGGDSVLGPRRKVPQRAREVYGEALEKLRGLRAWFSTQREVHLLGSSVLIVYEGDAAAAASAAAGPAAGRRPVRVCVVDFCNYVAGCGETDDNFGEGLERMMEMLTAIVTDT